MRILLVDDERGFVEALAERLRLRGFDPELAHDAAGAISAISAEPFEACVLDLRLPDASGVSVLRHARQTRPEMRVHMLTGHGNDQDRELCLGKGAVSFLHKPIAVDTLAAILRGEREPA